MNDLEKLILAYLVNNRAFDVTATDIVAHCVSNGWKRDQSHREIGFMVQDRKIVRHAIPGDYSTPSTYTIPEIV